MLGLGGTIEVTYTGTSWPGDAQRWEVSVAKLARLGYEPEYPLRRGLDVTVEHGRVGEDSQLMGRAVHLERNLFLASQVPHNFDGVFRQVVRFRLEWSVREGNHIFPETVELWNSLR